MILRELTADDATCVADIEARLFSEDNPWSREVFLTEFAHPHTFYVGAFDDEEIMMGYGGIAMLGPKTDPEFEIHTIGVDTQFQRRGVGRALMDQLTHAADLYDGPMFLEVRTDNDPAIALYESYGFVQLGIRKNYYKPSGKDAYTMKRDSRSERTKQ
ncbi:ribosomal protein S18-alanine N-acetyltransferase [Corynebacterium breve]|uniref:Ribosomal protein S18-alanine N-acetyltransferase n=1 Tax=Corynebacterium breve TaxID=3049799 RepID=A0ABY8VER4_9CORY|nr:ribosomal protein S18-alanine N-acetyltransferase [Corynebacterium breve]WIM68156.1 ribosomal protein S18-alanine N-acetyltransferase [Corynebacterium breve]